MPTYAYACTECPHRFDAHQSFSDAALTECPECAGRLRKVFGAVGVVFKGSGFYRTDSRDSSKRKGASAGSGSTSPSSGSNGSSTSSSDSSSSTASSSSASSSTSSPAPSSSTAPASSAASS